MTAFMRLCLALLPLTVLSTQARAACAISTGTAGLGFGSYSPLTFPGKLTSMDADSTGTVTVTCTGLTQAAAYSLKLSGGGSNDAFARSMAGTGGGARMNYNLFVDSNRSNPWGDGVAGGYFQGSIAAPGGTASHTYYGRVPAGQKTLRADSYSDQLLITLEVSP